MNYNILVAMVIAIFGLIVVAAAAKQLRHAFLVPEGYAGLLYHKGMAAQNAGNTLVLGMPGGFVPLKPNVRLHHPGTRTGRH